MPPANNTFATATLISTFPFDFTQTDINDAGVNFTVYYRFIAPANSRMIGAWGFSGNIGAGYRPNVRPYNGPAGAPTLILSIQAQNKPIQFPVIPGNEYFLEFIKNVDTAGPEDLRVQVEVAPLGLIDRGNIIVNDDSNGFPLVALSHTLDNTVINIVKDMPAGEGGDILPSSGISAIEHFPTNVIRVFNSEFIQLGSDLSHPSGDPRIRTCRGLGKFFVGINRNPCELKDILSTGVFGAVSIVMGGVTSMLGCAASNDGTILYYANNTSGSAIKRWDIALNSAMSDLVAGIAGRFIFDILVLSDNSIVAIFEQLGTGETIVRRYSAAGALLNTYPTVTNAEPVGTFSRLAYAVDDPLSFWRWHHPTAPLGQSIFTNIRVSDGVSLVTRNFVEFEGGIFNEAETATPAARFGNSFSCPFFIMTASGNNPLSGIYVLEPSKRNDTVYTSLNPITTEDRKIPDPTYRLAFLGE